LQDFVFGVPSSDWGIIKSWAIFDALTGGNMMLNGNLSDDREILFGQGAPAFYTGDIQVSVTLPNG